MSYSIRLGAGNLIHLSSPTYNLTPIFHLALTGEDSPSPAVSEFSAVVLRVPVERPRGLRVLSGRVAGETVAELRAALARIDSPELRPALRALEPSNGWGTVGSAREVLAELLGAAEGYPELGWHIT